MSPSAGTCCGSRRFDRIGGSLAGASLSPIRWATGLDFVLILFGTVVDTVVVHAVVHDVVHVLAPDFDR